MKFKVREGQVIIRYELHEKGDRKVMHQDIKYKREPYLLDMTYIKKEISYRIMSFLILNSWTKINKTNKSKMLCAKGW